MKLDEVLAELARACERSGSQRAWATANRITQQHVSDVLNRRREPGPKVLDALGLEREEQTYRRKR
jgi:hypothetical protein